MIRVLITGKNGQLGQCFQRLEQNYPKISFVFKSSTELDITNKNEIDAVFKNLKSFDYCINCAAYTAVDNAETDLETAENINVNGPKYLAQACKTYDVILIHVSTDFVFDGKASKPYTENSVTNPLGIYGKTKLKGEKEIAETLENYFIIRTSWLYSEFGNNFLKTMIRLAQNHIELKVVSDQIGTPTYAIDLAQVICEIIISNSSKYGVYHYSNEGVASWYDFAKSIFEFSKSEIKVLPIKTEDYPTPARRPCFSVLDKTKIKTYFRIEIPYWRDSLKTAVKNYHEQ